MVLKTYDLSVGLSGCVSMMFLAHRVVAATFLKLQMQTFEELHINGFLAMDPNGYC